VNPQHQADDICPAPPRIPPTPTVPHAPPIYLSSVYECADPDQADQLLSGGQGGFVYARDGHPNAHMLAEKCRRLHGAERAAIAASGMAALATAVLANLQQSDHIVASRYLYGKTLALVTAEASRLGIECAVVDTCDLAAVADAVTDRTRLVVVETITNPMLRVSNIAALAEIAHRHRAALLVDNTFASPVIFRPAQSGADLVMESLTKITSGHSDVVLGLLCGRAALWERVPAVMSTWGFAAAPFDCWLALRGVATLALRAARASENALPIASWLKAHPKIDHVQYPGLEDHPDHPLARQQFGERFGAMITFDLRGGRAAADSFIRAASRIPFCPSLGELDTTLSHPQSTSHRGLSETERAKLGITGGTIRLSVGIESTDYLLAALNDALSTL
jgi:cystathionine beta-lyase/cystathionine gamma-synthase